MVVAQLPCEFINNFNPQVSAFCTCFALYNTDIQICVEINSEDCTECTVSTSVFSLFLQRKMPILLTL